MYGMNGWCKPDGDLISRAEAIDAVCEMVKECFGADEEEQTAIAVTIRNLPSAQPDVTNKNVGDIFSRLDTAISNVAYILDALMAYRNIVDSGDCNRCGKKKTCEYVPHLGQLVRYNCPFYKQEGEG